MPRAMNKSSVKRKGVMWGFLGIALALAGIFIGGVVNQNRDGRFLSAPFCLCPLSARLAQNLHEISLPFADLRHPGPCCGHLYCVLK